MRLRFTTLFGIVASIVTGIALGIVGYRSEVAGGPASPGASAIEAAVEYIKANYVEEIPDHQLVNDALKGMLNGLDDHSRFLDRDAYERLRAQTAGQFGGIGVQLGLVDGYFTVIEPLADTPAERAGLAAGDRLIAVDDEPLKGKRLLQAIDLLRGPPGTDVRLTLSRSDRTFQATLTRSAIEADSVRARWLSPGYAYVRVASFQRHTGSDFAEAVTALQGANNIDGLVLDLRNNPGGVLGAAVDVADALLDRGLVICTEGRPTAQRLVHRASTGDLLRGAPVAVLINAGSASGSEIVASALQDHDRATVLGEKSYGKGSVQSVLPIAQDRALKLTTGYYYRPGGSAIHESGVLPDVVVASSNGEAALARALSIVQR